MTNVTVLPSRLAIGMCGLVVGGYCAFTAFRNGEGLAPGIDGMAFGSAFAAVVIGSWFLLPLAAEFRGTPATAIRAGWALCLAFVLVNAIGERRDGCHQAQRALGCHRRLHRCHRREVCHLLCHRQGKAGCHRRAAEPYQRWQARIGRCPGRDHRLGDAARCHRGWQSAADLHGSGPGHRRLAVHVRRARAGKGTAGD